MSAIMRVQNLAKNFGTVQAVRNIDFEIPEGICFGLLGPNGAGKTTTIEMMEGILSPSDGAVYFRDQKIDQKFKAKVGIQFQSTALPEFITVKETLELFSAFYPAPRPLDEVIDLCSLDDILERDNRKLSGGQKQRMLLGLAIIPRPEIVFLDEPTTGLDPQARRNFWDLIRHIRKEGTTVVLTTHYMDEAQILCDQIGIMDHGKILDIDTPDRLLAKHFSGVLLSLPDQGVGAPLDGATSTQGRWEIQTENLDTTIQQLLARQINLEGIQIHKPNLEDLFIHLTGSTLRT